MVKAHISLSRGILARTACLQMQMWSDLWEAGNTKSDHRSGIKDGQRFFEWKKKQKTCVRILNPAPDSESARKKAGGLLLWSVAVIWQPVIKSGLAFGSLYLEQLSLPSSVTDAAISDSDDCQLLTRLCLTHPSLLCLYLFFSGGGKSLAFSQQREASSRERQLELRHALSPSRRWLETSCFYRAGIFIPG